MHRRLSAMVAAAVLIVGSGLALAHNSLSAEYDIHNPAVVRGIVTTIEWTTPRSFLTIEGEGANGRLTEFRIDLGSPRVLEHHGWTRNTVKEGETVTVIGWQARRAPSRIKGSNVKIHGKEFGAGLTFSEATTPN